MNNDAFELGEKINTHTIGFKVYPALWEEYNFTDYDTSSLKWTEIKYLNSSNDDYSDDVKNLPNKKGGIYMYIVKSPVIWGVTDYLVYVGRAQATQSHSLRVRCKKYFSEFLREKERPLVTKMIKYYKDYLYLKYCTLDDNTTIVGLEAELINALLPPFNSDIPEKKVRQATLAFP